MISFSLTTNISESQKLKALSKYLGDMSESWKKISSILDDYIDGVFETEGFGKWQKSKSAQAESRLTLTKTGKMRMSFVPGNPNNINTFTAHQMYFGSKYRVTNKSGKSYNLAKIHHYGSDKMLAWNKYRFKLPSRPIITLSKESIERIRIQVKKDIGNALNNK